MIELRRVITLYEVIVTKVFIYEGKTLTIIIILVTKECFTWKLICKLKSDALFGVKPAQLLAIVKSAMENSLSVDADVAEIRSRRIEGYHPPLKGIIANFI